MSLLEAHPVALYGILDALADNDFTFQPAPAILNLVQTSKYLNSTVKL
jgi:hypothetical protein